MPAQEPMTLTYRHPTPEEIATNAPGATNCGDLADLAACVAENRDIINWFWGTIAELRAEVTELKAANGDARERGREEGRRSILDGTAEAARLLVDSARREVAMDDPPTPPELETACGGPRGGRRRRVTVNVHGTLVTMPVTPGVTDPHRLWRSLLAEHGRKAEQ